MGMIGTATEWSREKHSKKKVFNTSKEREEMFKEKYALFNPFILFVFKYYMYLTKRILVVPSVFTVFFLDHAPP